MTYLLPPKSLRTLENDKLNNKNITNIQGNEKHRGDRKFLSILFFNCIYLLCVYIIVFAIKINKHNFLRKNKFKISYIIV